MRTHYLIVLFAVLFVGSHAGWGQKTLTHTEPYRSYQRGIELFHQQQYANASEYFRQVLDAQSNQEENTFGNLKVKAEYYRARCSAELNQKDTDTLFRTFIDQHSSHPYSNLAAYHLGNYYYGNSMYQEAIPAYQQTDISNLSNKQILIKKFRLGYSYFFQKKFEEAEPYMKEVKNVEAKYYYPANYYYGYINYHQKDYKTALPAFQEAVQTDMYKNIVPYYITQIHFHQKNYQQLVDYAEPLLEERDRLRFRKKIKFLVGQGYYHLQQYEKALPHLEYYIQSTGGVTDQEVYALGYSYYKTEKYDKAIKQLEKLGFRDDSLSQNATYLLGDCFLKQNQKKHARNAFQQTAQLDYDKKLQQQALLNYAKLSYELEFHKEAIQATQKYIGQYPDSENFKEAQQLLSNIFLTTRNYKAALDILQDIETLKPKLKKAYQKVAYYRGVELFDQQQLKQAIRHFNYSLQHPINQKFNALAYYWKGEAHSQRNKCQKAIKNLNQFLALTDVVGDKLPKHVSYPIAAYNLGYCYYKQNDYNSALTYFEKAANDIETNKQELLKNDLTYQKVYPDILLRQADCQFHLDLYEKALRSYEKVIKDEMGGKDYALYQTGVLYGLMGQYEKKITRLEELTTTPRQRSFYTDDALFELASAYVETGQPQKAIQKLQTLMDNFPKSNYVKEARSKLALIYYNQGKPEQAIKEYKKVIEQYPRTEESKAALLSIKEIYIELNKPDQYMKYVESVPEADITASAEDSILYQSAETQYFKGNCQAATKNFTQYLNKFQEGFFTLPAHFYRARCYDQQKKYKQALSDYEYVIGQARNRFTEQALLRAAKICDKQIKSYARALSYYQQLYKVSEFKDHNLTALQGLIRITYELKKFKKTVKYANRLLEMEQSTPKDIMTAHLLRGKALLQQDKRNEALSSFKEVAEATKTKKGVQARYFIARIHFLRENYKGSKATCYEVINHIPSYDFWVAKSYILLADNYVHQGDTFQAKATLKSIIENYTGHRKEAIIGGARNKLTKLKAQEQPLKERKTTPDSLIMPQGNKK